MYCYSFLFSVINKMSITTSQVFQDSWLEEEEFKSWLRKVKDDQTNYCCIVCNKKLFLSTSGRCALTKHARGNKHIKNVTKRGNFFKPLTKHNEKCSSEKQCRQQCSHQSSSSAREPSTQQTLNSNIVTKNATTAEILWALKSILSGYSDSL